MYCVVVCLDDLPIKGAQQTPTGGYLNTKLATANLSHTHIGSMSMIMNCTKQEIVTPETSQQYLF